MKRKSQGDARYSDSVRGAAYVSASPRSVRGNGVHSTKVVGGDLRSKGAGKR